MSEPAVVVDRGEPDRPRFLALGLFLTVTIAAFEVTAVLTALPSIVDDLDGASLYGATVAANLLASILAVVVAGEMADRVGPARPYAISAVIFVLGLVVAGTAPTMPVVVLGRVLQGLGAGGFATLPYVAIRRAFAELEQPRMYAVLSAGWVLPSLIAPLAAGWLTDTFGWRWVFLGMVPLAVLVPVLVTARLARLPDLPPVPGDGDDGRAPSRAPAALQLTVGAGLVLAGLPQGRVELALPLIVGGVALGARPLLRLWPAGWTRAVVGLPAAIAARMCATAAFGGVDAFVPLAAERVHGVGATAQGFVIVGAALTWTLGQVVAARLVDTVATSRLVRVGFAVLALGAVLVAPVVRAETPLWTVFLAWSVGGLGMGLLFNPTTVVALGSVPEAESGRVSSQLSMADALGFASTNAIGGGLVAASERGTFALSTALLASFATTVAVAGLGFVIAGRVIRHHG